MMTLTIPSTAYPIGDEKCALFGLLLDTNARLSRDFGAELESQCQMPLAWFDVLLQLRNSDDGRLKMSQMADAIVHSTGGTTRLVDRLVRSRPSCAASTARATGEPCTWASPTRAASSSLKHSLYTFATSTRIWRLASATTNEPN